MVSGHALIVVRGLDRLVRPRRFKTFVSILALSILSFYCVFWSQNSLWVSRKQPTLSQGELLPGSVIPDRPRRLQNDDLVVSLTESPKPDQEIAKDIDEEVKDKCKYPVLDPFDPAIMSMSKFNSPLNCEGGVPHLVYMIDKTIKVNQSRTALLSNSTRSFKNCVYKSVDREPGSDVTTVVLYTSEPFQYGIVPRDGDDNLVVECFDTNHTVISRSFFTLIRVKSDLELELEDKYKKHLAVNSPKEVLNVLMIGLDGNSKQNFERHMPKTRNFLLNDLKAFELHKYNKVGDCTYSNLIPILTGIPWRKLESDNWTSHGYLDFVNEHFLWSKFGQVGYRTGAYFDETVGTPFHFIGKGWDKSPVDYYMRATIIERNNDTLMHWQHHQCIGDIPKIACDNDFWIQMASTFNNSRTKPYFAFSFCSELTHDDHNLASAGDNLYFQFFQELRDKNLLHNTVIVFFSDHGQRFGATMATYNGMMESRMPYFFFVFPPWFHQKYPELIRVLKINQERLSTNTDVHATIRDLINFQGATGKGDLNSTGISLFYEIPRERTCEHAGITLNYCVCHEMTAHNVSTNMERLLAAKIINTLKELREPHQDKCHELKFKSTNIIRKIEAASKGEGADDSALYQMTITTTPGNAIYEATLKYHSSAKIVEIIGDIKRLNMYRGQAECVGVAKVMPFCFCKK